MGIEPTRPAWKAGILPLNYTRISSQFTAASTTLVYNSIIPSNCQIFFAVFCKIFRKNFIYLQASATENKEERNLCEKLQNLPSVCLSKLKKICYNYIGMKNCSLNVCILLTFYGLYRMITAIQKRKTLIGKVKPKGIYSIRRAKASAPSKVIPCVCI